MPKSAARPAPGRVETGKAPHLDTTLVKGFSVLTALIESSTPLSLLALSTMLGLGKSNVHRLLATLTALGFVKQEADTKRYSATLKTWELGSTIIDRDLLKRAARPVLRDLYEKTSNTVFLTVLSGIDILYIEKIEALQGPRSSTRAGSRVPAGFTAAGKVLLAHQPDAPALLGRLKATVPAAASLNKAMLLEEFAEILSSGYALSEGALTKGVNSIAVAVSRGQNPPVAALGMAGPSSHMDRRKTKQYVRLLAAAADQMAELLGPSKPAE